MLKLVQYYQTDFISRTFQNNLAPKKKIFWRWNYYVYLLKPKPFLPKRLN